MGACPIAGWRASPGKGFDPFQIKLTNFCMDIYLEFPVLVSFGTFPGGGGWVGWVVGGNQH